VPHVRTESKGERFPLVLLAGLGLIFFAPAMFGSPILPCAQATVSTYDAGGFQCTIDGYTLEDFSFSNSTTGGAPLLSASDIVLTPSTTSGGMLFVFSPAEGSEFNVPEGDAQYIFQYELDPLLPQVMGTSIDTGPNDPVTLIGQFCGNGTVAPYVSGDPTSCSGTNTSGIFPKELEVTGNDQSATGNFPVLVTDLDTQLILNLDGPASIQFFETGVNIVGTGNAVPEPSTALWLVPGMLALAWLRKRAIAKAAR